VREIPFPTIAHLQGVLGCKHVTKAVEDRRKMATCTFSRTTHIRKKYIKNTFTHFYDYSLRR